MSVVELPVMHTLSLIVRHYQTNLTCKTFNKITDKCPGRQRQGKAEKLSQTTEDYGEIAECTVRFYVGPQNR